MQTKLTLDNREINTECQSFQATKGGFILTGQRIAVDLPFEPVRYYRHGWQSWSLTAWTPIERHITSSRPAVMRPMQVDPVYATSRNPNGSWVGAVEGQDGRVLLLGGLGLETHVELDGSQLKGWYESGKGDWFLAAGNEMEVFTSYAEQLAQKYGQGSAAKTSRVWCSWYSLYTQIDEAQLVRILNELGDLPFDVFQVDDGWQISIGDWEANQKFPSGMQAMAEKIRASHRTPGLWLAPLLVVPSSNLYRLHSDWLLRDENGKPVPAGYNWNEFLYALDTTHPEVLDWLKDLMKKVRTWGYDYVKLDFLYAGALPGMRHNGMSRETAYRHGLSAIREALGDAYFLTCGAPIIPSIGLCDGMRVGPDVAGHWDSARDDRLLNNLAIPGTRNAIRTTVNRLWLSPLLHTDPDVAYFNSYNTSMTTEQKRLLQDLAIICNYKATSDLPAWLTETERQELRQFLDSSPKVRRVSRNVFSLDGRQVNFDEAVQLPEESSLSEKIGGAFLGALANSPVILKLNAWLTNVNVDRTATE
jgi:alpha-galactosidase